MTRKASEMTFPQDHLREVEHVEEHSVASVVIVSIAMIALALLGATLILG